MPDQYGDRFWSTSMLKVVKKSPGLPKGIDLNSRGLQSAVDDSPETLVMLSDILTAEGYEMRPADSGELALSAVHAAQPDLIVLDIRMNGIDGFEVCRRLESKPGEPAHSGDLSSSLNETRERVEGLKLGAVDFISKPFQKEELLARIQTHLELSRLRNRLEERVVERTASLNAANEQLRLELGERRRANRALRESEERFRSVADNAPVVIWTSGPDTAVTFLNKYGQALTGRNLEELKSDRWKEVVHPEDLAIQLGIQLDSFRRARISHGGPASVTPTENTAGCSIR